MVKAQITAFREYVLYSSWSMGMINRSNSTCTILFTGGFILTLKCRSLIAYVSVYIAT